MELATCSAYPHVSSSLQIEWFSSFYIEWVYNTCAFFLVHPITLSRVALTRSIDRLFSTTHTLFNTPFTHTQRSTCVFALTITYVLTSIEPDLVLAVS